MPAPRRPQSAPLPSPRPVRRLGSLRRRRPLAACSGLLAVVGVALLATAGPSTAPAIAEVHHGEGYQATVLGWTSWYGSYGLGHLGAGWCIDHGLRAPDAAFGYVPTDVADASADTRAALAWAASRPLDGRVDAAARMLALHDLMGATYPFGRLDVDVLGPHQLGGFGGAEHAVVDRARAIKADALAHASLRAPLSLDLVLPEVPPGGSGTVEATLRDADGRGVEGVWIGLGASGGALDRTGGTSGSDGTVRAVIQPGLGVVRATADAMAPSLQLSAWASSSVPAQRIVRPDSVTLHAEGSYHAATPTTTTPPTTVPPTTAPPTTTTTASPTTTTTRPATTSTTVVTTTTSAPPPTTTTIVPTTTSTSAPPPATTSTTLATPTTTAPTPTTTTTPAPPAAPPTSPPRTSTPPTPPTARPPSTTTLPRTGSGRSTGIALLGGALLLGGGAAVDASRQRARRHPPR